MDEMALHYNARALCDTLIHTYAYIHIYTYRFTHTGLWELQITHHQQSFLMCLLDVSISSLVSCRCYSCLLHYTWHPCAQSGNNIIIPETIFRPWHIVTNRRVG